MDNTFDKIVEFAKFLGLRRKFSLEIEKVYRIIFKTERAKKVYVRILPRHFARKTVHLTFISSQIDMNLRKSKNLRKFWLAATLHYFSTDYGLMNFRNPHNSGLFYVLQVQIGTHYFFKWTFGGVLSKNQVSFSFDVTYRKSETFMGSVINFLEKWSKFISVY